jgi:hypothetical protein
VAAAAQAGQRCCLQDFQTQPSQPVLWRLAWLDALILERCAVTALRCHQALLTPQLQRLLMQLQLCLVSGLARCSMWQGQGNAAAYRQLLLVLCTWLATQLLPLLLCKCHHSLLLPDLQIRRLPGQQCSYLLNQGCGLKPHPPPAAAAALWQLSCCLLLRHPPAAAIAPAAAAAQPAAVCAAAEQLPGRMLLCCC